jgi:hypothetical protein
MMATNSSIQETQVALNLPEPVSSLIIKSKSIEKAMTGNAYFTESATRVTDLGKANDNLVKSEAGFNTTPPSVSRETRDGHKIVVKNILRKLRGDVQDVVDDNPGAALEIIASACMDYKRKAHRGKRQNDAVNGDEEGTVLLTAMGKGPHEWRMSTDQKEWTSLPPTRTSQTTVDDLIPGTVYFFQNKPILSGNDTTDWSQIIKLRIG